MITKANEPNPLVETGSLLSAIDGEGFNPKQNPRSVTFPPPSLATFPPTSTELNVIFFGTSVVKEDKL
jgi:hypothetical protein